MNTRLNRCMVAEIPQYLRLYERAAMKVYASVILYCYIVDWAPRSDLLCQPSGLVISMVTTGM